MPATNYTAIGGVGSVVTPGATPSSNVTLGGSPTFGYNTDGNLEITESYTPPGSLGTFAGVHWYAEVPDQQSAPPLIADGATPWDGTKIAIGNNKQNIVDIGRRDYDPNNLTQVFDLPPVTAAMSIRLVAVSYSNQVENHYTGSPSVVIAVTPDTGATKLLAADAYTPMATWGVSPATVGAPYNLDGKLDQDIKFTGIVVPPLTIPKKFSGWEIWSSGWPNSAVDIPYTQETSTQDGTGIVITVASPKTVLQITYWLRSVAGVGTRVKRNPIVPGITPSVVLTLGTTGGTVDLSAAIPLSFNGAELRINSTTNQLEVNGIDLGKVITSSIDPTVLAITSGKLVITGIDLKKALGTSFNNTDLQLNPTTNILEIKGLDLGKVITATLGSAMAVAAGVMDVTNLAATKITAGTLAAGVILASSIAATQILAGTLAAGVVYAGTINVGQINAGTLNVGVILASSIAATQILAGTLGAGVIYAGTINASQINAGTVAALTITTATINGGAITGTSLLLNSNGTTTAINNVTDVNVSQPIGLSVVDNATSIYSGTSPFGHYVMDGAGKILAAISKNGLGSYGGLGLYDTSGTPSKVIIDSHLMGVYIGTGSGLLYPNKIIGVRKTGWGLPSGTLSRATFDPSTASALTVAQTLAALLTDLFGNSSGHGLIGT